MSRDTFDEGLAALKTDLLRAEGPSITNMGNYRFAVLPYNPADEFAVRKKVRWVTDELKTLGWNVFDLSAHKLLMRKLKNEDPEVLESWVQREKRLAAKGKNDRALRASVDYFENLIGGKEGLAQDAIAEIHRLADEAQVNPDKTLVWVSRMGSLYPFFRTSTLLKHLDGNTRRIPVVVLYPGSRVDKTAAAGNAWFEPMLSIVQGAHAMLELRNFDRAVIRNPEYNFQTGVAYSTIGASFTARLHRFKSVFSDTGQSIFHTMVSELVCLLNSSVGRWILSSLNPTVHFHVGDVNRLPLFPMESADQIVAQLDVAFTQHEQARETSVEFLRPGPSGWKYAQGWAQTAVDRPSGAPLRPYEPVFTPNTAADNLSYALGLALGRFLPPDLVQVEPSQPGAPISAIAQDQNQPHAVPHGILFLSEAGDSLDHPACEKLREFWQQTPLAKGTLRDYLKAKFFTDDHLKRYDKRPIYFPLSSTSKTFVAYLSIHRWTSNTLEHLLADHLQPELHRLGGDLNDLATARHQGDVKSQGQAQARYDQVMKLVGELQDFTDQIRQIAERGAPPIDSKCPAREVDRPFEMNLDDGVMINSAGLWPLLDPQWKDPKKWWKELSEAKGKKDYDWAHLAKHYWPSRVDAKCQSDPSLAVAHGCFWKYHPTKAYEWELRLQSPDELGPSFKLDEPDSEHHRSQFESEHRDKASELRESEEKRRTKKASKAARSAAADQAQLELEETV